MRVKVGGTYIYRRTLKGSIKYLDRNGREVWHEWDGIELHAEYCSEDLAELYSWRYRDIGGMIILKWFIRFFFIVTLTNLRVSFLN
jgi:hypothetical protein